MWAQDVSSNELVGTAGTELDSHANMIVLGEQAAVISYTGLNVEVRAFADEVKGLSQVPIIDGVIA